MPLCCVQVLVKLAISGTEAGMTHAAQALAKIGVVMDPKIAFPGQRVRFPLFRFF